MKRLLVMFVLLLVVFTALSDAGRKGKDKTKKMKKGKDGKQRDRVARDCGPWVWGECIANEGECGLGLKKATRDGTDCKVVSKTKRCRIPCEGDRQRKARDCGPWVSGECIANEGECGLGVKQSTRDGADCKIVSQTKRCRIPCEGDRQRKECKYEVGELLDCDQSTGSRTIVMRLKKGDPETCPEEKTVTKKCKDKGKKACKYNKGQWGLCDTLTNTRVRLDTLKEKRSDPEAECASERVIVKKCRFACKYQYSDWGECDESTNSRSREGVLSRKSNTPADCRDTDVQTRSCSNKNGKEKCFFGPWEGFSKCVDGQRTKSRPIIAGGKRCERRAMVTRNCKSKEE
ncbi:uncharacterized protein LOC144452835 isoform X2 [Glandiceps talaboti]